MPGIIPSINSSSIIFLLGFPNSLLLMLFIAISKSNLSSFILGLLTVDLTSKFIIDFRGCL